IVPNGPAVDEIFRLSLHDALPIWCLPGPPESVISSCTLVRIGVSRSWPSSGCTARPTPKTGDVAFEPSLLLLPPQPPAIQSYHRSEEHTSELQSRENLVCRPLLEK